MADLLFHHPWLGYDVLLHVNLNDSSLLQILSLLTLLLGRIPLSIIEEKLACFYFERLRLVQISVLYQSEH
jgi:hypothetical protein